MSENFKLTRRQFNKAAALATFAVISKNIEAAETNSGTIKVGLIGCGGRGFGAVKDCMEGNDNIKIIALADVFEDRLKDCRKKLESMQGRNYKGKVDIDDGHCFVGLDAYKKILETEVDMIIHATPPFARPQHIEAVIEAGKHVFTEKPVAVDPAGIRRFIKAAEKAKEKGLCLHTGTQRRSSNAYRETVKKIQDGAIGEIIAARVYWNGELPFCHERKPGESDLAYRLRNWYNQIWTCGDNIVEQHIHNIDVINWIMGTHPVKVVASGGRAWKPLEEKYGDLWDHFECDFEYPNGVHMFSFSRHWNNSKNDVFEQVFGTKGKSMCNDMGKDTINPYVQEHIDIIKAIRGEAPYLNTGIECAESTMTAIMGRMSAYTGQELTWDEAINADLSIVPEDLDWNKPYPIGPIPVPGKA